MASLVGVAELLLFLKLLDLLGFGVILRGHGDCDTFEQPAFLPRSARTSCLNLHTVAALSAHILRDSEGGDLIAHNFSLWLVILGREVFVVDLRPVDFFLCHELLLVGDHDDELGIVEIEVRLVGVQQRNVDL